MDEGVRRQILSLLEGHRIMTLATNRPDGWPQATTVGYVSEGLAIYFLCGRDSQKAANLARDPRVSLTIDHDADQVMEIQGLSMAACAARVPDGPEATRIMGLLMSRYPPQQGVPLAAPRSEDVAFFRLTPTVISVLDYTKGFGHTELVPCEGVEA